MLLLKSLSCAFSKDNLLCTSRDETSFDFKHNLSVFLRKVFETGTAS